MQTQLKQTTLQDLHIVSARRPEELESCFICLRPLDPEADNLRCVKTVRTAFAPLSRRPHLIFVLQVNLYRNILWKSAPVPNNILTSLQARYLERASCIYICYMCEPSSKKAEKQEESGGEVDYPSNFLCKTLNHFDDQEHVSLDRLQMLKALLCLMGEVECPEKRVRHVLRSKNKAVLEYCIFFMQKLFESEGQNVKKFRTEDQLCIFQIKILCKWHLLGCPHSLPKREENRLFRKLWDKPLGMLFRKLNPEIHGDMFIHHAEFQVVDSGCAACQWKQEMETYGVPAPAYVDQMLYSLPEIQRLISHHHERREHAVRLCYACKRISVVAYTQYRRICSNFPLEYQEHNIIHYYNKLLRC